MIKFNGYDFIACANRQHLGKYAGVSHGRPTDHDAVASGFFHHLYGVLGDPRPAKAEAGQVYLKDIIEYLFQWVENQDKA